MKLAGITGTITPKQRFGTNVAIQAPDQLLKAFSWMVLSCLGFSSMSAFVKSLSPGIPQFELVFFRSLITLIGLLPFLFRSKITLFPDGKRLLIFRGVAGFGGISCLFYSTAHLPLAIATILNWSSLLFVILISYFFLNERIRGSALAWTAVAVVGLLILVRMDLQWSGEIPSLPGVAVAIGVLGAVFSSLAVTAVRAATGRFGSTTIVFYLSVVSTVLAAPLAYLEFVVPSPFQWGQILAVGICGGLAQFAMTQGYRAASAGLVSTMNLMTSAFSAFFGWLLFSESLSAIQWFGMATLAIGVVLATLSSKRYV